MPYPEGFEDRVVGLMSLFEGLSEACSSRILPTFLLPWFATPFSFFGHSSLLAFCQRTLTASNARCDRVYETMHENSR